MRLDLFLKISRLIQRRSLAQEFCDAGLVKVNGLNAKSSKDIRINDIIEIKRRNRVTKIQISAVPDKKQLSTKDAAESLYKTISTEVYED